MSLTATSSSRTAREELGVAGAHAAEADGGHLNAAVRRGFLLRGQRGCGESGGGGLQKMTSGGGHMLPYLL